MRLPALLISDLHLVDDSSCEYRWSLFPWVNQVVRDEGVKTVLILGDLTDAKDNHSAELTNRVVAAIKSIPCQITILVGNHDWLKAGQEFFRFLNVLPNVRYITSPSEDQGVGLRDVSAYFLPYSKNPAKDWEGMDFSHYDYLFMHQTVTGSISSNGMSMAGDDLPDLNAGKVYSGDIHVPQVIKGVEYVGSPYHVHFGDAFKPRAVLIDVHRRAHDLHFKTISRMALTVSSLRELRKIKLSPGDQVKLKIELTEAEKHDWSRIRREAVSVLREAEAVVAGVQLVVQKSNRRVIIGEDQQRTRALSPSDTVVKFVASEELGGEALDVALEIVEDKEKS
jgi:DNA repair exonuclease SbcCD nuclease subunit